MAIGFDQYVVGPTACIPKGTEKLQEQRHPIRFTLGFNQADHVTRETYKRSLVQRSRPGWSYRRTRAGQVLTSLGDRLVQFRYSPTQLEGGIMASVLVF